MKSRRTFFRIRLYHALTVALAAIAVGTALLSTAYGQGANNQRIVGIVRDSSGAVLAGVSVTVVNTGTQQTRTDTTDQAGRYVITGLSIGDYQVEARLQGFKESIQRQISLNVDQAATVDVTLQLGDIKESVEVKAGGQGLQLESAVVGNVVDNREVLALPLNGRSFAELALTTPGVVSAPTTQVGNPSGRQDVTAGQKANFSVAGTRPEAGNMFIYNGINVSNDFLGGSFVYPPIDSLQEFKIQTDNYSAEYGVRTAQVTLVSKGGSNAFHGAAYEFLRNDVVDASTFFANLAGQPKPPLKQNQFGYAFGGPIRKNKLFFFFNQEETRIRVGTTSTTTQPTSAMRTGDFTGWIRTIKDPMTGKPFANNIIPSTRISPIAINALNLAGYPLPNLPTQTLNYTSSPTKSTDIGQYNLRLDYDLRANDKLWGSWYRAASSTDTPKFTNTTGTLENVNAQAFSMNYTHIFGPTLLNEIRAGFNYAFDNSPNIGPPDLTNDKLGFPNNGNSPNPTGLIAGIPLFSITGYGALGELNQSPLLFKTRHYQLGDTMSWIKNGHLIKVGADIIREHEDQRFLNLGRGNYTFSGQYSSDGLADFLLGLPSQVRLDVIPPGSNIFESLQRAWHTYYFVQDDWKITPRLTLNIGLRYEYNQPIVEARNRQENFVLQNGVINKITAPDPTYGRSLVNSDKNNFAPRIGLAWRPFGDKTVIRAAFGLFYNYAAFDGPQVLAYNAPFVQRYILTNPSTGPVFDLANAFPPSQLANSSGALGEDVNHVDGKVRQWNFTVERELASSLTLQAGYVGSLATNLDFEPCVNCAPPGPGAFPARRPLPTQIAFTSTIDGVTATYHALMVQLTKRVTAGLQFRTSYTWSKSIDDASNQTAGPQDPYNAEADKGLSSFDVPHRFLFTSVWEIPVGNGRRFLSSAHGIVDTLLGGWRLAPILTIQSGIPFNVTQSTNTANAEVGCCRPNRIANGALPSDQRSRLLWFDTTAFMAPPPFFYGNSGRNILFGPGSSTLDLAISKDFRMPWREGHSLEIRADSFNALNHTNFGAPGSNINAAGFGAISSSGPARIMQFALKYMF